MDAINTQDLWKLRCGLEEVYRFNQWRNIIWYLNANGKNTQLPTSVATFLERMRHFYFENPHALLTVNTWDSLWGKTSASRALKDIQVQIEFIRGHKLFSRERLRPVFQRCLASLDRAQLLLRRVSDLGALVLQAVKPDLDFGERRASQAELTQSYLEIQALHSKVSLRQEPGPGPAASPALVEGLERVRSCALHALNVQVTARAEALTRLSLHELNRLVCGPAWNPGELPRDYAQRVCGAASFKLLLCDDLDSIVPALRVHPVLDALAHWIEAVKAIREELYDPCSRSSQRYVAHLDAWLQGGPAPFELDAGEDALLAFRCKAWKSVPQPEELLVHLYVQPEGLSGNRYLKLEQLPRLKRGMARALWQVHWQDSVMRADLSDYQAPAPELPLELGSQALSWTEHERAEFLRQDLKLLFTARLARQASSALAFEALTASGFGRQAKTLIDSVEWLLQSYPADPRIYLVLNSLQEELAAWQNCVSKLSPAHAAAWQHEQEALNIYLEPRLKRYREEHGKLDQAAIAAMSDLYAGCVSRLGSPDCSLAFGQEALGVHRVQLQALAAREHSPLLSWHWDYQACYRFDARSSAEDMLENGMLMSSVLLRALVYWLYHGDLPDMVAKTYAAQLSIVFDALFPAATKRSWRDVGKPLASQPPRAEQDQGEGPDTG